MQEFNVNQELLFRIIEIKLNTKTEKPLKRGFKTWLKYVRLWKPVND